MHQNCHFNDFYHQNGHFDGKRLTNKMANDHAKDGQMFLVHFLRS
jgi:hypothetical protein